MRIQSLLKRKAIAWAGQMTRLARSFAPAHIRSAISSHVEEKNESTFIIRTTANRKLAPDARAWEYGSGEHARRGLKQKYPIVSKKGVFGALAFYENANGTWDYDMFDPPMPRVHLQDGRGLFYGVMHPGIEAANSGKGYIGPAQIQVRKSIKAELKKELTEAIRLDLRESFGRK